jgi:hypothetical protein
MLSLMMSSSMELERFGAAIMASSIFAGLIPKQAR